MFGTESLLTFLIASMLLCMAPGQDTMYIATRSITQGFRAGLISIAGIMTGNSIHTVAAALGLSAVIAASSSAFSIIKYLGAAYLVYLGIRMLLDASRSELEKASEPENCSSWKLYREGLLTNILNPKVVLFFLAFLPQFVRTNSEYKVLAFLYLGVLFIGIAIMWCVLLAAISAYLTQFLRRSLSSVPMVRRAGGIAFVGLGVSLLRSRAT